ncbi:S-methyl-5-thioribose-1-phosphate isomerase [Thermoplasmatales archaeon ex4484_30]|nr:MAG: S-methyl-5-thioribose-1-phosphate isomerase [Thermoplasmata archaeon]OYT61326.1 MAG: S-methyl-5-thioribose-1-phosphate isomerase [Thermoplasmatales archaeon ex4484_30]
MLVNGKEMRSLWYEDECLKLIDQRKLPAKLEIFEAKSAEDVAYAIKEMVVRGAPAIGCAAAYGVAMAKDKEKAAKMLKETRPTAYDLFYAIDYVLEKARQGEDAIKVAGEYTEGIVKKCRKIGEHGKKLIGKNARILTHCNAGALACVDYGTALAPIRMAKDMQPFVWVDETRPRLQGLLTAWELEREGIEHAVIADNAAGYFMRNGEVDLVIVGADRIAKSYDVANKIGTYEKAVIAKENGIPFYVAAPLSTFDKRIENGSQIKIEERCGEEVTKVYPWKPHRVRNPAFDVTPAKYITGIITEEGIIELQKK